MMKKLREAARASRLLGCVSYHLLRCIYLGCYDERMTELIHSLSTLNPMYVKVFQALAGSSGFLSQPVQDFLSYFSDQVPFTDDEEQFDNLQKILQSVASAYPKLTVTNLSDKPIHSGTVSLVYSGQLIHEDGQPSPIVVKCIRKNARVTMEAALAEANLVLKACNLVPNLRHLNLGRVLQENWSVLMDQISMKTELSNMEAMRSSCKEREFVKIPTAYPEFTEHSDDILVMERIEGRRVEELEEQEKEEYGVLLAKQSISAIMSDGLYHGDLHRGNILFLKQDNVKQLGIIDFGIVGRLDETERLTLTSFYLSLGVRNYEDVVNSLIGSLTNKDILDAMDEGKRTSVVRQLVDIAEEACDSRHGFGPRHMAEINKVFVKNGMELAPIFCRIELALAMNATVSKSLETKNKTFMTYMHEALCSKFDMSIYDV